MMMTTTMTMTSKNRDNRVLERHAGYHNVAATAATTNFTKKDTSSIASAHNNSAAAIADLKRQSKHHRLTLGNSASLFHARDLRSSNASIRDTGVGNGNANNNINTNTSSDDASVGAGAGSIFGANMSNSNGGSYSKSSAVNGLSERNGNENSGSTSNRDHSYHRRQSHDHNFNRHLKSCQHHAPSKNPTVRHFARSNEMQEPTTSQKAKSPLRALASVGAISFASVAETLAGGNRSDGGSGDTGNRSVSGSSNRRAFGRDGRPADSFNNVSVRQHNDTMATAASFHGFRSTRSVDRNDLAVHDSRTVILVPHQSRKTRRATNADQRTTFSSKQSASTTVPAPSLQVRGSSTAFSQSQPQLYPEVLVSTSQTPLPSLSSLHRLSTAVVGDAAATAAAITTSISTETKNSTSTSSSLLTGLGLAAPIPSTAGITTPKALGKRSAVSSVPSTPTVGAAITATTMPPPSTTPRKNLESDLVTSMHTLPLTGGSTFRATERELLLSLESTKKEKSTPIPHHNHHHHNNHHNHPQQHHHPYHHDNRKPRYPNTTTPSATIPSVNTAISDPLALSGKTGWMAAEHEMAVLDAFAECAKLDSRNTERLIEALISTSDANPYFNATAYVMSRFL